MDNSRESSFTKRVTIWFMFSLYFKIFFKKTPLNFEL